MQPEEGPSDQHDAALTLHFDSTPNRVPPGKETQTCEYLAPLERDLVVTGFGTKQARGGHHLVLYRSITPKPAGTVEDCTEGDSMANFLLALTQITAQETSTASIEFPESMAVVLPKGTQIVTQSHYINAADEPLETNDQVDIWFSDKPASDFQILRLFVAGTNAFEIPAHGTAAARVGCTLPHDVDFMSMIPHMHEWGAGAHLKVGAGADAKFVLNYDTWEPGWRDVPPITSFLDGNTVSAEGHYSGGQPVELECRWSNDEDRPLTYPSEMCAGVGYFLTDAPDATDIMCLTPLP